MFMADVAIIEWNIVRQYDWASIRQRLWWFQMFRDGACIYQERCENFMASEWSLAREESRLPSAISIVVRLKFFFQNRSNIDFLLLRRYFHQLAITRKSNIVSHM